MPQITGPVTEKAIKEGKNGEYVEIEVHPEGKQYPVKMRDFDGFVQACPGGVKKGDIITIGFAEKEGTYQGKTITYRNVNFIAKGRLGEDSHPDDVDAFERSFNSDTQPGRPTASRTPTHPTPGADPWAKPAAGYVDPTRASIEAQVALKEAGEFVRDAINQGRLSADNPETVRDMLEAYTVMCLSVLRFAQQEGK